MPERADLIAVLIIDRPLCLDCIADKTGMTPLSVEGYLERMDLGPVDRTPEGRCRACGRLTTVFSLPRRE